MFMETHVYKIPAEATAKVNALLGSEDLFDVKAKCAKCGEGFESKIKASEFSQYLPTEKGGKELPPKKQCKCNGVFKFEKKVLIKNEFARNGYTLRGAEALGLKEGNFLYIKADAEFFKKNEHLLIQTGAKLLSGKEAEQVEKKIEAEEESAAAGMGGIFG